MTEVITDHNSAVDGEVTPEIALQYAGVTDEAGNEIPEGVREVAAGKIAEASAQNRQWKDNIGGLPVRDQMVILASPTIHVPDGFNPEPEPEPVPLTDAPPPDPATAQTPNVAPQPQGV